MSELNKNETVKYSVLYAISAIVLIIVASFQFPPKVEASSTKTLEGTVYRTPTGTVVEVVKVPGFGECFITPETVVCK